MTQQGQKTTEQWVDFISQHELPAITSMAKLLDKFANDDVSSLAKLSQSILHDQALSSCILKVSNSVQHMGHSKVTTISRATVVLGIHAVKNICLTSKLIEGLFNSKNLSPEVFQRLTQLMASSFYAGLLAKMMVPGYDDDTQEEVYLAAMLYRIGETAFWSVGGELSEKLIKEINLSDHEFTLRCVDLLGGKFSDMSKGLAKAWSLGELLEKALDQPQSRTKEMQIIYLADKLSNFISSPPESIDEFNDLLNEICKLKGINIKQLTEKINNTRENAIELLNSYGASILEGAIKPLPTIASFIKQPQFNVELGVSQEKAQLLAIKELSLLTKSSKDFNQFLQITLQSLVKNIGFDRCSFFMLTSDKKHLQTRFSYSNKGEIEDFSYKVDIRNSENIFSYVLNSITCEYISGYKELKWRNYITKSIADLLSDGCLCLFPVQINNNTIGIITAQRLTKGAQISIDELSQFSFLTEHLNMCLSIISRR